MNCFSVLSISPAINLHFSRYEDFCVGTLYTKPSAQNQAGGIITQEAPIDASNVMYVYNGKATRIGFAEKDGKKVRVAKSTGDIID